MVTTGLLSPSIGAELVLAVFGPEVTGVAMSAVLVGAWEEGLAAAVDVDVVSTMDDLREGAWNGETAAAAALVDAG